MGNAILLVAKAVVIPVKSPPSAQPTRMLPETKVRRFMIWWKGTTEDTGAGREEVTLFDGFLNSRRSDIARPRSHR